MIKRIAVKEINREDANLILWLTNGCQLTIVDAKGNEKKRVVYVDEETGILRKKSVGLLAVDGTKPIISLAEVSDVVDGSLTDNFAHDCLYEAKDCVFSLTYGNGCKSLDFIAHDPKTKWAWVRGLTLLVAKLSLASRQNHSSDDIINYQFQAADLNKDGLINTDEAISALGHLHLTLNDRYINELVQMAKIDNKGSYLMDRREFAVLVKILTHCPEIRRIFDQARGTGIHLNGMRLAAFLRQTQQQLIDHANVGNFVRKYELSFALRGSDCFSYEGFRAFLLSEDNSLQVPETLYQVYHDMTRPLSDYWIFSSHNTYLTNTQFTGQCGVNNYAKALRAGCRSVQLDTWDGNNDEPIVTTNGQTYTSRVYFRDVLRTIQEEAFVTSPYPVIISIENHCSPPQQRRMAFYLKTILEDSLCPNAYDPKNPGVLLSPEALKFRILIKSKSLQQNYYLSHHNQQWSQHYHSGTLHSHSSHSTSRPTSSMGHRMSPEYSQSSSLNDLTMRKVSPELSELVALPSVPMPKFNKGQQSTLTQGVSNIVESEALFQAETVPTEIRNHTNHNLVRVYPTSMRLDSSNFNPLPILLAGYQMVAMNFQANDKNFKMYQAFFRDNGLAGYLLKPCLAPTHTRMIPAMVLKLQIIGGYQLGGRYFGSMKKSASSKKVGKTNPEPPKTLRLPIDPYVMVHVHGVPDDHLKFQTSVIANNGFNPIWNELFTIRITRPDVALLRLIVVDASVGQMDGSGFTGQFSVPVRLLRPGFRSVRIDSDNPQQVSRLLVHITMESQNN